MRNKKKLYIVSNRLPYNIDKESKELNLGTGGLATALRGLSEPKNPGGPEKQGDPGTSQSSPYEIHWVGSIVGEEAKSVWVDYCGEFEQLKNVHPIFLDEQTYQSYYNDLANSVLWPLFHYEQNLVPDDGEAMRAYREVNQTFADRILEFTTEEDLIWVHDYHFCLLPKMIREKSQAAQIGFFLHIPFPSSEIFRTLPSRLEVLEGLSGADLVGFHDYSYLSHFQKAVSVLTGKTSELLYYRHDSGRTALGVFPVSIETEKVEELSGSDSVKEQMDAFVAKKSHTKLILGVDRLDYTKGLELKLEAFRCYLKQYPEAIGKVSLLQLAVPTRYGVSKYQELKGMIDQLVGEINGEFGDPSYVPVRYMYTSVDQDQLMALYRSADALLVTAKRDGMNLVCMEYIAAQDKTNPGVAIVSEFAGASSVLSHCLRINPWDIPQTVATIEQALGMELDERKSRFEASMAFLNRYNSYEWARGFIQRFELSVRYNRESIERVNVDHPVSLGEKFVSFILDTLGANKHLPAESLHLFLDFDGTLAGIEDRPENVKLKDSIHEVIVELSKMDAVVLHIVSGRNKTFLESRMEGIRCHIAAEHGSSHRSRDTNEWNNRIDTRRTKDWYLTCASIMQDYELRVPESHVEKKDNAIVWHYRLSPKAFSQIQALKLKEELEMGLANRPVTVKLGKSIVEVKSIEANKGRYMRDLLEKSDNVLAFLSLGDDSTDEDMFQVQDSKHFSIKVGTEQSASQYHLREQKDVEPFLKSCLKQLREL